MPRASLALQDRAAVENVGTILVVSFAVLMAGGVYLWSQSFSNGSQDESTARAVALSPEGAVGSSAQGETKTYVVARATGGLRYSHVSLLLDGMPLECHAAAPAGNSYRLTGAGRDLECGSPAAPDLPLQAGDKLIITAENGLAGSRLQIVDIAPNRVIAAYDVY